MNSNLMGIIMPEKILFFWQAYSIYICALRWVIYYFCSEIYSAWTQIQYKIYSNTIINNFSTMRKRHATQCYNKVTIWVSYERQFDWDHYNSQRKIVGCMLNMLNKKILFFDTHNDPHRIDVHLRPILQLRYNIVLRDAFSL